MTSIINTYKKYKFMDLIIKNFLILFWILGIFLSWKHIQYWTSRQGLSRYEKREWNIYLRRTLISPGLSVHPTTELSVISAQIDPEFLPQSVWPAGVSGESIWFPHVQSVQLRLENIQLGRQLAKIFSVFSGGNISKIIGDKVNLRRRSH